MSKKSVVFMAMLVLCGAMSAKSIVIANTGAPVPPTPWANTGAPVPPTPWLALNTGAPVPPTPWTNTGAPVPPTPWI